MAVAPLVVAIGYKVAVPAPKPAPAALEMVISDEVVKTVMTVLAGMPGPVMAWPTMPEVNNATEATDVDPDVVTTASVVPRVTAVISLGLAATLMP